MNNSNPDSHGPIALGMFAFIVRDLKHYFPDVQTMEWIANCVSTISGLAALAWIIYQWGQARKK